MSREEAIKELTDLLPEEFLSEYTDAIKMAIETLEQEPCGDTVSRSAVIDTLTKTSGIRGDALKALYDLPPVTPQPCGDCISCDAVMHILDEVGGDFDSPREAVVQIDYIADMVSELPFVTAQPKMGYWFIDERPESDREVICSNCDKPIFKYHKLDFDYRPKYCPNCGAKMQEVEE